MNAGWILFAVLVAFTAAQNDDFKNWARKQGKSYKSAGSKSEADAAKAYAENQANIAKHNSDPNATYKQGTNAQSDMTQEERDKCKGSITDGIKENKKNNTKGTNGTNTKYKSSAPKPTFDTKNYKASIPASLDYRRWDYDRNHEFRKNEFANPNLLIFNSSYFYSQLNRLDITSLRVTSLTSILVIKFKLKQK